jgi:hypothetical protein
MFDVIWGLLIHDTLKQRQIIGRSRLENTSRMISKLASKVDCEINFVVL